MRPCLEIVVTNAGAELSRYTVAPGEYTIGRASTSSILIKVGPVSRQHARMVVGENGAVAVEDLASANGTHLGEQLIAGLTAWPPATPLRIGDITLHLLAIPPERPPNEYAPTLSPSQAGDYQAAPATPPSERRIVSAETATIIRRHLPLVTREAQQLDREKEIARGGMGAVLQARESATRRTVAMKIMLRGEDAKGTLRFIEEAQVTAQLEHPNIVPVHELGIDGSGQVFYTMKLVQGITLKKIIELLHKKTPETVAKYSLPTLLTIFQKAADAVAFAHSKGAIHRDLKPANIMVGSFGEVLVMDWGLAKLVPPGAAPPEPKPPMPSAANAPRPAGAVMTSARGDEGEIYATMDGAVMGTPHYMAPEQARGEIDKLDERTDIFALGAILYHLLTLQLPFGGTTAREIITKIVAGEPPATPLSFNKSAGAIALPHCPGGLIPDSLSAVCMKALAHHPLQRYATVKALQADILSYQNGFATSAEQASLARQLKLFLRRHRPVVTAAGTALLLAALGIGGWQVWRYRLKVGEHDRLVESAERASKNGDWDTSVSALGRAILIHDVMPTRAKLRDSLLTGAKEDLKRERYGAAAIKLQEMLRLAPNDRDAQELMPYALGEGFVSVEAKFPAELVEIALDENLRPSRGANGVRSVGALPVKELRLRQGFHHFEIHRDGRRWCSLPVEVKRAGRARVVIPISEIPAGYEYVHEGDFIQGDEGTTQADGFIGKRTRRIAGFFIRATLVAGEEYFRFREAANYAGLVNAALAADGLGAADIQSGAKGPGDLQAFRENIPNAELIPVRALSYYEAAAFAKWADARLPTEEEWEKAARGIDGRTFSIGLLPPGQVENHMTKPPTRESADVSPFGCYGLTLTLWQWTSSRSETDSNRYVVKGGAGRVSLDMKPARRKPMEPKTKYHSVSVIFCKDLGEMK